MKGKAAISSSLTGAVLPLQAVKDEVFSTGAVGKGVAIFPTDGKLYAPIDGTVTTVFPTGHAIGITSNEGVEILMHLGLDTVETKGKYFDVKVEKDMQVEKGQLLTTFDVEGITDAGYDITSPIIITNSDEFSDIDTSDVENIQAGEQLLTVAQ